MRESSLRTVVIGVLAFSAFFILGAAVERQSLNTPAEIEDAIFGNANLAKIDGRHALVYPDQDGKPLLIYDIDLMVFYPYNNAGPRTKLLKLFDIKNDGTQVFSAIDLLSPAAITTAGSVALGISVKDILLTKELRTVIGQIPKHRDVVIGVLGALSGYAIGKLAAREYYIPKVDSPEARKIIADSKKWRANHERLILNVQMNIFWELFAIGDSTKRKECEQVLSATTKEIYKNMAGRGLLILTGEDIELFGQRLSDCRLAARSTADDFFSFKKLFLPMLWFPVIVLCVGAAIGLVYLLGSSLAEYRAKRIKYPPLR